MKTDEAKEMTLEKAISKTPDVKGKFCKGLGAVKTSEKSKFVVSNTHLLSGSLDIDSATKFLFPNDNRWDYAVEYNKEVFFVEIHPCSTSEIQTVLHKLSWLKNWLKTRAPDISALKSTSRNPYIWVFTNRFDILPTSKTYRQLSLSGLKVARRWEYDKM
ncbi:MAG: hypothetical protein IJ257_06480 [Treponema sp.]|nr:hypothetical protein [Treponema sp.]